MMMFQEEYDKLTRGEKNQFSESINALLYREFILRKSYDRKSQMFKADPVYLFLERHFSLIEDYLSYIDVTVTKDDDEGVIFVSSAIEMNHLRLDIVTTLIVYALRSFYESAIAKDPQDRIVLMSSSSLNALLQESGLSNLTKRLSSSTIASALRTLDSFNIITRYSNTYGDPTYKFYILPTLRFVISSEKMNELYSFLTQKPEESNSSLLFNTFSAPKQEEVQSQTDDVATPVATKMGVDNPVDFS